MSNMKVLIMIVITTLSIGVSEVNGQIGNVQQLSKELTQALKNSSCEEKLSVANKLLSGDLNSIIRKYGLSQLKNFADQEALIRIFMRQIKEKTTNFTCEEKSKLLETLLDGNLTKIRQVVDGNVTVKHGRFMNIRNKGSATQDIQAMKNLGKQIQNTTVSLTCEQKNEIFDNLLISDWAALENFGIQKPNLAENGQKLFSTILKTAREVELISCAEKSQLFDNLIHGKCQTAYELLGKLDEISYFFIEAKNATKNMTCEEINEIIQFAFQGNFQLAWQVKNCVLISNTVRAQIPSNRMY